MSEDIPLRRSVLRAVDWPSVITISFLLASLVVIAIAALAITAEHSPRFYYVSRQGPIMCVTASEDWYMDTNVFCSEDVDRLVGLMQEMNSSLREGKGAVPPKHLAAHR